jgi:hypothetical protein
MPRNPKKIKSGSDQAMEWTKTIGKEISRRKEPDTERENERVEARRQRPIKPIFNPKRTAFSHLAPRMSSNPKMPNPASNVGYRGG